MLEIEKIVPKNGRILVQTKKQEEKTSSGLLLPGKLDQKFKTAKVLAVGDNKEYEVGQEIIFGAFAGTTLCEDNGYTLLSEEEVYATIEQ